MANRAFFTQANRVLDLVGEPISGARAFFYEPGTVTQITVYSDVDTTVPAAQPVLSNSSGIFPDVYIPGSSPVKILITDASGNTLPGYPADWVPNPSFGADASSIGFAATDDLPQTNVQAAIEAAAALASSQTEVFQRSFTEWTTSGTGNDYTITPSPAITGYGAWQVFLVRPDRGNTGSATLNVNGLGARTIFRINASGAPVGLAAGEISAGRQFIAVYDGSAFTMLGDRAVYGSTANGQYLRLPDGTQMCWHNVSLDLAITTPFVGGFRSPLQTWTYPIAFSQLVNQQGTPGALSAAGIVFNSLSATAAEYAFTAFATQTTAAARVARLFAIGRY